MSFTMSTSPSDGGKLPPTVILLSPFLFAIQLPPNSVDEPQLDVKEGQLPEQIHTPDSSEQVDSALTVAEAETRRATSKEGIFILILFVGRLL